MQADQINENEMKLEFDARSVNEGFARMAVAAFVAELTRFQAFALPTSKDKQRTQPTSR